MSTHPQELIDLVASTLDGFDASNIRRTVDGVTHFDGHAIAVLDAIREYEQAQVAALPAPPSLEALLAMHDVSSVSFLLDTGPGADGNPMVTRVEAEVWQYGDVTNGVGPTIEAAIRKAVGDIAAAQERAGNG